jgi:AraC-like DNA-binding protein
MLKRINPATDGLVKPQMGFTRLGQPLSFNRAPCAALEPWLGRIYATKVDLPADYRLESCLFNDTSVLRIQLQGDWYATTHDGPRHHTRAALIFGPQTRCMPVTVVGSFISVGAFLRPGTGHALLGRDASLLVDRLTTFEDFGLDGARALAALPCDAEPETWCAILEALLVEFVATASRQQPDPITQAFEVLSFTDPQASIAAFAKQHDISPRQFERQVRRDFGMSPKQVMRRARALDMASHLRGVADAAEANEMALRYYDQAQMSREFTEFFGMSPRRFMATPNPILTLTLETRQARRLAALERLSPGETPPWA